MRLPLLCVEAIFSLRQAFRNSEAEANRRVMNVNLHRKCISIWLMRIQQRYHLIWQIARFVIVWTGISKWLGEVLRGTRYFPTKAHRQKITIIYQLNGWFRWWYTNMVENTRRQAMRALTPRNVTTHQGNNLIYEKNTNCLLYWLCINHYYH